MPEIRIQRQHNLGIDKARTIAQKWCDDLVRKYDMECTSAVGPEADKIDFRRVGANGTLLVSPDRFEITAQLGFLLGAFAKTIEDEIERKLDDLLAESKPSRKKAAAGASK